MAEPITIARIAAAVGRGVVDERSIERKVLVGLLFALVGSALMMTAFAGAFASSVPSFLFESHEDPAALTAQIQAYADLEAKLQNDAINDATAGAPSGQTVHTNLDLPTWRYLLALTAVQCDQDFAKADPQAVYNLVRSSIAYTYTAEGTSTVLATSTYPPVADLAPRLAPAGAAFQGADAGQAAERYLAILGTFDETGHVLDASGLNGAGGPGATALTPEVLGQLDRQGVAVDFPPVRLALSVLGCPYVWGATGPDTFDCSGLADWIMWRYTSFTARGTTSSMWNTLGTGVSLSQIQPGDMIFWEAGHVHHVGMYIGGGKYVHAPRTGDVVKISELSARSSTIASIRRPPWDAAKLVPTP
ncbi:MAG: C40 family peptidase [Coriobacteriia bacterium]|nr:C40 family peptidase [Coriobacteriia bacterium]